MSQTPSTEQQSNALTRTASFQYPAAHYNHLNPEQQQKLEDFRAICIKDGYYTAATDDKPASHDDETLLRYLRARKFVPADAFGQFKDTEDWRKKHEIDNLYNTIDIDEYDETRRLYPQWTGRRDKRGIPVYVFEVAALNSARMADYNKSLSKKPSKGDIGHNLMRLFALYENLIQFTMPLCSAVPNRPFSDTPVSQSSNIVDISRVGLKQFWNLKGHMQEASQLATAHYPETLDRIFIIGAPSFFPTVWSWIKRWFDPITVSKIFILSAAEVKPTLEQYLEPRDIPKKYGGELDWSWGDLPILEPDITNALRWEHPAKDKHGNSAFPIGPVRWRTTEDGNLSAVALGTQNGKQRNELVAFLTPGADAEIQTLSPMEKRNRLIRSTTGNHTHPAEGTEYFPSSGETPPASDKGVSPPNGIASGTTTPRPTAAGAALGASALGAHAGAGQDESVQQGDFASATAHTTPTPPIAGVVRQGTSGSRFEQQQGTHAEGQLAEGTPSTVHHGHGDKTNVMEPATIGQAPKDVSVPEAQPPVDAQAGRQQSYLEQAKAAAGSAAATVSAASMTAAESAMQAVGLGGQEGKEGELQAAKAEATVDKPHDPAVDAMENKDVEDFIRSKYASANHPSNTTAAQD